MSTFNSTQKNPSYVDKELAARVFYIEVNPTLRAILIPSLFYSMHRQFVKECMLIVDARRNRVHVRIMKGYCSAHIVKGIELLVELYRLDSGGTIKLRFLPKQVFYLIKVHDRKMRTLPIMYQNHHAMLVGPSCFKEKQPSMEEIFFHNVDSIQTNTYKRVNLQPEEGDETGNQENHDESNPLLTLSLGPPNRTRNLLGNARAKSIRIRSLIRIPSSSTMANGLSLTTRNIPIDFNLNDPLRLSLGLNENYFTPAETSAWDKIVKKHEVFDQEALITNAMGKNKLSNTPDVIPNQYQ
ncbi:hypothetical protein PIB30_008492 [Stylosanthes scabra]|uniref:Uncharacterized protein n=1 Tax=Stylosanthes scabra TaxID=79078 RepID=A0ABU6Y4Y7_9FABA|nr:hypothetical protein [Stylosanthes scabra]